jgi:hypothetical protein
MKKLFLLLAFMLSVGIMAQSTAVSNSEDLDPTCYVLVHVVPDVQLMICPFQRPGEYTFQLCPPFYEQNSNKDWWEEIFSYWCQHATFPPGVEVIDFDPLE